MTMPLRPEADALRIGMLAGIYTRADAVTWADLAIAELDKPCGELIDLSTSEGLDASSFAALLGAMPGEADLALTKRILLARLGAKLAKGADLASLAPARAPQTELVPFTADEKRLASGPEAARLFAACEATRLKDV
jgi:hypothetical protein